MEREHTFIKTDENGHITKLFLQGKEIFFRRDIWAGFQPYMVLQGKNSSVSMHRCGEASFEGRAAGLEFRLNYELDEELRVYFSVNNHTETAFKPTTLGLRSGIDCYMEKYPEWNHKLFPTLLRCEKSHFWGYNEMPDGTVLAYASEEPAASWSLCYNELETLEAVYLTGGHRIYTWNVHLLNRAPGPERHPLQDTLPPGGEITLTLYFRRLESIREVPQMAAQASGAPVFQLPCCTLEAGQQFQIKVWNARNIRLIAPDGSEETAAVNPQGEIHRMAGSQTGTYRVRAAADNGKEAEAMIYVRRSHSWYLEQGREAVLHNRPLHTHHVEAFNSLFTILLSRKYIPDTGKDELLEQDFCRITDLLYDDRKRTVRENPWRIQDSAALCCLFAFRYEITGEPEDLRKSGYLADYLLSCQGEDGAYYSIHSPESKTHYTAVTYIAKYILDAARIEERAAKKYPEFIIPAERHGKSARKAIAELVRSRDNIDTEGELTLEDGMISCSLLQIAYAALSMEEGEEKQAYLSAAEYMYSLHECLTQKLIPDCRMNGGTLRFWEAQYNLHIFHNMMNSPCGWTCWKIYGTWYLYQLTGEKKYLLDTVNALGACLQLVDGKSGKLRWGFICDPYVETLRYAEDKETGEGRLIDDILGEQYVDMVSPWHRTEAFPRKKWAIDNLVHEVFKCLSEIGLTNACVYEEDDGSFFTFNCRAWREGEAVVILPSEELVERVHCNLKKETQVEILHSGEKAPQDGKSLVQWFRMGWLEAYSRQRKENYKE